MATTLKDISRKAGVSIQTVSRILRGCGENYRPDTRKLVLGLADELGYHPNHLSRSLVQGKSMAVGVITKGLNVPATAEHVQKFIHVAQERGYLTYTANIDQYGDDSERFIEIARDLLGRQVDGLVVYRGLPLSDSTIKFLDECGVPVVFIGKWGPEESARRIVLDLDVAINQLADHLAELGHRHIAYFPSTGQLDFPAHKLRPMQIAFEKRGMELRLSRNWWIETRNHHQIAQETYNIVSEFLQDGVGDITCLMIINDIGVMGAMAALREAHISVPDDISVVGFDDMDGAQFCRPPLTTVRHPNSTAIGEAAFEMLNSLMQDAQADIEKQYFPFELVVRESTGMAKKEFNESTIYQK